MASLFEFVNHFSADLAKLAERIEEKMFNEPHVTMIESRLYSEHLVKIISKEEGLEEAYPLKHAERIHKLYRQNAIEEDVYMKLEWIRKKGNKAVHDVMEAEVSDVVKAHQFLFEISVWYMQVYVTYNFEAPAYKLPIHTAPESNSWKMEDMNGLIKPYLDKKLDDMWIEIQRQLNDIKTETERLQNSTQEIRLPISKIHLIFKDKTLVLSNELADMAINVLPLKGCSYLLTELSRIGIHSLRNITESLDQLHMRLNGIGTYTIEKFWEQLNNMDGAQLINAQTNSNIGSKTMAISEAIYKIFTENNFTLINKTKKAAEFEHIISKEIVYLLPNKVITIVLHPDTVKGHFKIPDKPSHSTALRRFPKGINNGKTPTNFGYPFKFERERELNDFLSKISNL